MTDRVLVAGATGFVGARLAAHLHRAGVPVRCGARSVGRARAACPGYDWVPFDVDDPEGLRRALRGVRALVYLVHHLCEGRDDLVAREAAVARRVREAVERAGVERVVYLGAPAPEGTASEHLRARRVTGEELAAGAASVVELRASMIVGAGSESWRMVRDLALRLPVLVVPSWLRARTQPIWIDDVVRALALAVEVGRERAGVHDLPGPEVLGAREILVRVARAAGRRPAVLPLPMVGPERSSAWLALVTRADPEVARHLVHGLAGDLVCPDGGFWDVVGEGPHTSFDRAVRRALADDVPEHLPGRAWELAWGAARRSAQGVLRRA